MTSYLEQNIKRKKSSRLKVGLEWYWSVCDILKEIAESPTFQEFSPYIALLWPDGDWPSAVVVADVLLLINHSSSSQRSALAAIETF